MYSELKKLKLAILILALPYIAFANIMGNPNSGFFRLKENLLGRLGESFKS